jgi:hypothetical protein
VIGAVTNGGGAVHPSVVRSTTIVAVALVAVAALIVSSAPGAVIATGATGASVVDAQAAPGLKVPRTIAGLVAESNPGTLETVDGLRAGLARATGLTTTAGSVYADPGGAPRSVVFAAGTGRVASPADAVNAAIAAAGEEGAAVTRVRDVPAGPRGGFARCGSTDTEAEPTVTCGWADGGSVGVAVFANRPPAEAASILARLRDAVGRP